MQEIAAEEIGLTEFIACDGYRHQASKTRVEAQFLMLKLLKLPLMRNARFVPSWKAHIAIKLVDIYYSMSLKQVLVSAAAAVAALPFFTHLPAKAYSCAELLRGMERAYDKFQAAELTGDEYTMLQSY